jgi:type III secretory pathway component EscS
MKNPVSPKVIVAAIVGIIFTSIASNVTALTPDMFDFLGPWKLFVFGVVVTAIITAAAWWKSDPLRILPGDQPADSTNTSSSAPAVTTPNVPTTIIVKPNTPVDLNAATSAALAAATPIPASPEAPPADQLAGRDEPAPTA